MPHRTLHEAEESLKRRISSYTKRLDTLKKRLENVTGLNITGDLLKDLCVIKGWELSNHDPKKYQLQARINSSKYDNCKTKISECEIIGVYHKYEGTYCITITCADISTLCGFAHAYGITEIVNDIFNPTKAIQELNRELKELEHNMKIFNNSNFVFRSLLKKEK